MKQKNFYFYSNLLAWGLVLLLASNYVFGWTTPSSTPPAGNVEISYSPWTTSGSDIYYNDGNVGIGATSTSAKLDVEVSSGGAATIGSSDNSAIGNYAIAMGEATIASGTMSTAMGSWTTASGYASTAMGYDTIASNYTSVAMGAHTTASGESSTAMGSGTTASGEASTAIGAGTIASGDYSTAIGANTTAIGNWGSIAMGRDIIVEGDYSFGIGLANDATPPTITQNNVMAIMGGNVGIGTTTPSGLLHIQGTSDNPQLIIRASENQATSTPSFVLQSSDGTAVIEMRTGESWQGWNQDNTFIGKDVGRSCGLFCEFNTIVGQRAFYSNYQGSNNTALGYETLFSNTTGWGNTAVGDSALNANTTGDRNTAVGDIALYKNTTGSFNTAMGDGAGLKITTGTNNTFLGYSAGNSTSQKVDAVNSMALGNGAYTDASNKVTIGNTAITWIGGQVVWSTYSDFRQKYDIKNYDHGLDLILKLQPVEFLVKDDKTKKIHSGFIAQEVEKIGIPFYGLNIPQSEQGYYSLSYSEFVVPLVNAVKEQQKQIEDLKAELEGLKAQLNLGQ